MSASVLVTATDVVLRDGVRLATDVIRVADEQARPVLLVRTPYGRAGLRQGLDPVALARRGWAVVLQDIRGRWDSGGDYRPWHQDQADGAEVVAWCRDQPWCTGSIVMQGASYDGVTAWLAASTLPEGLAAIAPVVSTASIFDPLITTGGTLNLGLITNWGLGHVTVGSPETPPEVAARAGALLADWSDTVARPDVLDQLSACLPPAAEWIDIWRDQRSVPWTEPLAGTALEREGVPAYQLTGWFDCFVEGALAAYAALRRTPAGTAQRLVVGPWPHAGVFSTSCGDLDFGPAASGWARFPAEQEAFLRAAAAGEHLEGGASIWVIGHDDWTELEQWPPPTQPTLLQAHEVGPRTARWSAAPAEDARRDSTGVLRWQHDPTNPVPTIGGRTLHPDPPAPPGPKDRRSLTERADVVVIATEELDRDWTVMGEATIELTLTSTSAVTDLHLHLIDEHPDGTAIGLVSRAHRLPITPGTAQRFRLGVGTIAARITAGHRLAVHIASSDFPLHDVTSEPGERSIALAAEQPLLVEVPLWDGSAGVRVSP